jgi:hypothetical protein
LLLLPSIWRDPEEKQKKKPTKKIDPTAQARSSIRRRLPVHDQGNRSRGRVAREATIVPPPRFERSPPPVPAISVRYSRRNGVPPISTLLEHADRSTALPPPPPPVPHSRNYYSLDQRERELRLSLDDLHAQAARLRRDAQDFIQSSGEQHGDQWTEAERRSLLETAAAAQSRRPNSVIMRRRYHPEASPDDLATSSAAPPAESAERTSRSVLPTPPLESSEPDGDSLFLPESRTTIGRPSHPLSRSWRAGSPVNGLGDRNRSPTPADAWEIMESTIEPDTTLPSADSSFATVPATSSFASSTDTTITEPERGMAVGGTTRRSTHENEEDGNEGEDSGSDSVSSADVDCTDEEYLAQAEEFAREMYFSEIATSEGRIRVRNLLRPSDRSSRTIDVGFRLIDDALNTQEGRERVTNLHSNDAIHRAVRFRDTARRHPDRSPPYRPNSPPATSQEPPSANPVSPPSGDRDGSFIFFGDLISDDQDLESMRRVARRLANRDEVPDDFWASMGVNVRLGPRHQRRAHRERALERVRGARVERGNARL